MIDQYVGVKTQKSSGIDPAFDNVGYIGLRAYEVQVKEQMTKTKECRHDRF